MLQNRCQDKPCFIPRTVFKSPYYLHILYSKYVLALSLLASKTLLGKTIDTCYTHKTKALNLVAPAVCVKWEELTSNHFMNIAASNNNHQKIYKTANTLV